SAAKEAAAAPATSAGQYPRSATGFFRGNREGGQTSGFYINLWGLVPILALFLLWVHTTQWVDEDGRSLKLNYELWNSLVFLIGVLGFVVVVSIPAFWLGFVLLLASYGVPLGLYIKERNERVPESAKVMTPEHIQ